jgi:hypothetical protein
MAQKQKLQQKDPQGRAQGFQAVNPADGPLAVKCGQLPAGAGKEIARDRAEGSQQGQEKKQGQARGQGLAQGQRGQ